ncbi:MAG: NAD-dependent epimerase [Alphaproteobacteria bacterium]|nr:NAD-dependent epimerase [Alphaproteobacteria bacterium]
MQKILITGAAGFIGFHLAHALCTQDTEILGIDNLNDYYDVSLKQARLKELEPYENFTFQKLDLADTPAMEKIFKEFKPDIVVNLAAQAGVRYSLENPHAYINSNIVGFTNILEGCRHAQVKHLIFASSSSVYGANSKIPFQETDRVDHPVSLYAATKKSNELMAHSYAHLYDLPCTGLRFFTVYGPWGRPDMAYFKFADAIMAGEPIPVFNHGDMRRDFTYIDDVVEGIVKLFDKVPKQENGSKPYRIYNIGNNKPEQLMDMIGFLEEALGQRAETNMLPMQPGDVKETYANIDALETAVGFKPSTGLKDGLQKFAQWYKEYQNS